MAILNLVSLIAKDCLVRDENRKQTLGKCSVPKANYSIEMVSVFFLAFKSAHKSHFGTMSYHVMRLWSCFSFQDAGDVIFMLLVIFAAIVALFALLGWSGCYFFR